MKKIYQKNMIINGRYYINDIESGEDYEVSKEAYEQYFEQKKLIMKSIVDKGYKGIVIVCGTGSSFKDKLFPTPNRVTYDKPEGNYE